MRDTNSKNGTRSRIDSNLDQLMRIKQEIDDEKS